MKRLMTLLLALLMLASAATAFAEPVLPAEDLEETEEIEIVSVEETVEEEELELEPAEAELLPGEEILIEEEALPGEEEIPEELPEEELTVEEEEEIPEDGNEAAEEIVSQPSNVTTYDGGKANFVVGATGATAFKWQWRANSSDGWKDTTLNGYNGNALSFTATLGMNGRQFQCLVTDGSGTKATSPATLTVVASGTITAQPAGCTVPNGGTAKFTVKALGSGLKYQWQWRANSSGTWANTTLPGCNTATLSFTASDGMNARQYRCVVTNPSGKGNTSNAATLTVKGEQIVTHPSDVTASANGTAKFTVKALGSGLKYQWQWRSGSSGAWANTTLNGYNTPTLSFTATSGMNGRQYRCVVTDAGGSINSNAATLTVLAGAKITNHPASATVESGKSVSFKVKAVGSDLQYQWQWRANSGGTWANTSLNGCKTDTLSFTVSAGMNARQYRCGVKAPSGSTAWSNAATLTVINPTTFTTQPKDCKVQENDVASFTVVAVGTGLTYQWQWRANASDSWKDTTLNGYNTATLLFAASAGMNQRQYRCGARNAANVIAWSNPVTLTVGTPAVVNQNPWDCTVYETETAEFSTYVTGKGLQYQWKWRSSPSGAWKNTSLNGYNTSILSFPATLAMDGRQFCCEVKDKYGNTATSNPATLTVKASDDLYYLVDLSSWEWEDTMEELGFTVTQTIDEFGGSIRDAMLYPNGGGTIESRYEDYPNSISTSVTLEGLTSAKYGIKHVTTLMTVDEAKNKLISQGLGSPRKFVEDGMIEYYWGWSYSDDLHFGIWFKTSDDEHIASLEAHRSYYYQSTDM